MEEQLKSIISKYIKTAADQVTPQTVIDRSAVASSIILHRMYAHLANEGIVVSDYTLIKTYGQLVANIHGKEVSPALAETVPAVVNASSAVVNELPVGIDIENISAMPEVNDFREDAFYTMNFAPAEIAYCILQTNPYASFAGLFAAKEAIVKADNSNQGKTFNTILIDHLPDGKPVYPGFQLSIAHTNQTAVAIAIKNIPLPTPSNALPANISGNSTFPSLIAVAALLVALFALILFIFRH